MTKNRIWTVIAILALLSATVGYGANLADGGGSPYELPDPIPPHVPAELLVQFASQIDPDQADSLGAAEGYTVLSVNQHLNIYRVQVNGDLQELWTTLSKSPVVRAVQPNYYVYALPVPNDPYYRDGDTLGISFSSLADLNDYQRWYLGPDMLNAEAAWDITTGRTDVVIAVIDSGVDLDHPDLAANIWVNPGEVSGNGTDDYGNGFVDDVNGWDFFSNDNNPNPDLGNNVDDDGNGKADDVASHGTEVGGVAAAIGNNGNSIAGAAWNSKVMALKVFTDDWGPPPPMLSTPLPTRPTTGPRSLT